MMLIIVVNTAEIRKFESRKILIFDQHHQLSLKRVDVVNIHVI